MTALAPGSAAPAFSLKGLDGARYNLNTTLRQSPVVLVAFLKVSCPVCHLAFPYLERLHRSYPSIRIWGVSQDDSDSTQTFTRMFGCTFPVLLDDQLETTVQYDLTHVPSIFLILQDGTISKSIVGWAKADLEQLNVELAKHARVPVIPLFTDADEVPEVRPGCISKRPSSA